MSYLVGLVYRWGGQVVRMEEKYKIIISPMDFAVDE